MEGNRYPDPRLVIAQRDRHNRSSELSQPPFRVAQMDTRRHRSIGDFVPTLPPNQADEQHLFGEALSLDLGHLAQAGIDFGDEPFEDPFLDA